MRWSYKIGEFAGIGVYMHATFPLLIAFAALPDLLSGDLVSALGNTLFILTLFVCVVLHEYGHALTARRYDIRTQDITLLPIGGVARLERMPAKPSQEFVVAVAGPLVNLVIAVTLFVVLTAFGATPSLFAVSWPGESFLERLLTINVMLILFNLIPAFPMDGGRILRAVLAMQMDYTQATRIAARLGQGIAVVFGLIGFFVNPLLVITALFVWMGAAQEAELVESRAWMRGRTVGQAMRTHIRTLTPYEWLAQAVDYALATAQQDFPVVERGRVVGLLTREALMAGLQRFGAFAPVYLAMSATVETVEMDSPLADASEKMEAHGLHAIAVTHNGLLVGLLTLESIREFMRLERLLNVHSPAARQMPMV